MRGRLPGKLRRVARAKYEAPPSDAELAAFGMKRTDYANDEVLLWPETEPAWALWGKVRNQWRAGAGGAYALDYNVLFYVLERMGLSAEDHDDLFSSVQVIEAEILTVWQEEQEAAEKKRATA